MNQECYHLYESSGNVVKKEWTDARDYCSSLGGHLLQLETREELDFVTDRFTRQGSSDIFAWTSLNDKDQGS